jgi:RNA polymerase sigma-70 factor, ECF subfamily
MELIMLAIINKNPIQWFEQYGDYLFAFAMSRLHNEMLAEDLVQETLLAALQSSPKSSNEASEKTWLTAILKHKIIDYYRHASRQATFVSDHIEDDFFDESGAWSESPSDWETTPESLFEQKEFQMILQECLAELPKNLAAVFTLREIEGLECREICEVLNLSPNNLWVMLYRARLQLRRAIERRWLNQKTRSSLQTGELVFVN